MNAAVKTTMILLATTLAGCAGNRRPQVAAAPAEPLAGDYSLTGSVAGRRIAGAIRFDSTGRAFLVLRSTPAGAFRCESQQWVNDRNLQVSCGAVQLRLAVANRSIAPQATISFDVPTTARREHDPFACQPTAPDFTCGGPSGRETLSVRTNRSTGKVTVQRNAVE
ncbi:hypothetical protein [Gemmatimonas sp.]|uniref:hypothetical protein n=1 Tax=Gemmatimonas sp. TaxID=1962908 RepID=UPI00286C4AC2|nr:hypothetical protein [Gemmatimonas sp.]